MAEGNTSEGSRIKTRIAGLNFSDKSPVKGEEVTIAGYLQSYDQKGKKWDPVEKKKVELYIDGERIEEDSTDYNGNFSFGYTFETLGEHGVEVKFDGTQEYAQISGSSLLKVITEKQRKKIDKILKVLVAALALIILIAIISLYAAKG